MIDTAQYFKDHLGGEITVPEESNSNDMILTLFSLVDSSHLVYKLDQGAEYFAVSRNLHLALFFKVKTVRKATRKGFTSS